MKHRDWRAFTCRVWEAILFRHGFGTFLGARDYLLECVLQQDGGNIRPVARATGDSRPSSDHGGAQRAAGL
eukprot:5984310-Pyramimonas_sp.AAC.1